MKTEASAREQFGLTRIVIKLILHERIGATAVNTTLEKTFFGVRVWVRVGSKNKHKTNLGRLLQSLQNQQKHYLSSYCLMIRYGQQLSPAASSLLDAALIKSPK